MRITAISAYEREVYQHVNVTAGQTYHAEVWIKTQGVHGTGAALRLIWLNGSGAAITTSVIGTAGPTQAWTLYSGQVAAPSGAVRVRFQLYVGKDPDNAGTAWFDDAVFGPAAVSPTDTAPPTVAITSPPNGGSVQGVVTINADATDDSGVGGVVFRVNGTALGPEDTAAPYSASWDTRSLPAGNYQVSAVARDIAGKQTTAVHTVTVSSASGTGDHVLPTVTITAPAASSTISGTTYQITADASDDVGVAGVTFRIDGQQVGTEDTSAPYSVPINTTAWSNGSHSITAVARDLSGNTRTSTAVTFAIHNTQALDVTYCTPGGAAQKMDVFYPPAGTPTPFPVLMFIHGGGWIAGDKTSDVGRQDFPRFTRRGYLVVSINYRLGANLFPVYVEDAKCAIRHLRANASFYRLDPQRFGVWGHSAGGHIAALTALTDPGVWEGTGGYPGLSSQVKAVVTYEAPFDLTGGAQDFETTVIGDIDRVFGARKVEASPINYVTANDPPVMIVHGTLDQSIYMPQAQKMYDRLVATGVTVRFLKVTNGGHYLTAPAKSGTTASPDRLTISRLVGDFFDQYVKN
ncbi:MAG TPA: Ig-like domain-containing protein [Longimicrobiales bacterium]